MNLSDFGQFLSTRRSVRRYQDREVEPELLDTILKMGEKAPSAGNVESWDIVVVRDPSVREFLADAALQQEHIAHAPVVLVVCANYVRSMARYSERGILYALEEATIVATYLMLGAQAAGLATCWTGGFDDEQVRDILKLPTHIRPVTLLTLGYGAEAAISPVRRDVQEHIHQDEW
ncbi:MAG: nitroreductase family protein [Methanospirillum sp.]|uniref:nitroreductase family protein n=1 Tax=Methanospirillum sp. TaxID=45200 RepID=UPI002374F992|nr:nitroreductase family protein [Methanospirillum sp.]MDD1729551.1 nitroreductase family protein [Methanospirillum sp.]